MYKYARWSLFFVIPFVLDRWTKYLVLIDVIRTTIVTNFFNVYVTFNRGIAWSIGSDLQDMHRFMLNFFIACVLIYFISYMRHVLHNAYLTIACMLILAGGVSNFIDRLWYGSVIDFLQFHCLDWFFPVFNIADVSITFGAILLLYATIFTEES